MGFRPPSSFQPGYGNTSPFRSYIRNAPAPAPEQQQPQPQQSGGGIGSVAIPAAIGYGGYSALSGGAAPAMEGLATTEAANAAWNAPAIAATEAAGATSPWALGGIGSAGNAILPIAGAIGAGDLAIRQPGGTAGAVQGGLSGAAMGSYFGLPGAAIGGAVGALGGGLMKASGKDKDQVMRDSMREALVGTGFLAQDYSLQLADGSSFNMGADGGATLPNWDGKSVRPYYNVDASSPLSHQAIGWANPIAEAIAGKNDKLKTDLVGYLVNATTSNATTLDGVRSNILAILQKNGYDENKLRASMDELLARGEITPQEREAYMYGIGTLFSGDASKYEYKDPNSGSVVNVGSGGSAVPAPPTPTNSTMLQPAPTMTAPGAQVAPVAMPGRDGASSFKNYINSQLPPSLNMRQAPVEKPLQVPAPVASTNTVQQAPAPAPAAPPPTPVAQPGRGAAPTTSGIRPIGSRGYDRDRDGRAFPLRLG